MSNDEVYARVAQTSHSVCGCEARNVCVIRCSVARREMFGEFGFFIFAVRPLRRGEPSSDCHPSGLSGIWRVERNLYK